MNLYIRKHDFIYFLICFFMIDCLLLPGVSAILPIASARGFRIGQIVVTFVAPLMFLQLAKMIPKFLWFRIGYIVFIILNLFIQYVIGNVEGENFIKVLAIPYALMRVALFFILGMFVIRKFEEQQIPVILQKITYIIVILGLINIIVACLQSMNVLNINSIIETLYTKGEYQNTLFLFKNRPAALFDGKVVQFTVFLTFSLFLSLFVKWKNIIFKFTYIALCGLLILFAQTRAILLGFAFTLPFLMLVKGVNKIIVATFMVSILYISIFGIPEEKLYRYMIFYNLISNKGYSLVESITNNKDFLARIDKTWAANLEQFEKNPILGIGYSFTANDSQFLTVLARSGIVGLLIVFLEQVYIIKYAFYNSKKAQHHVVYGFNRSIAYTWIVFTVTAIFHPVFDGGRALELIYFVFGCFHVANFRQNKHAKSIDYLTDKKTTSSSENDSYIPC